MTYEETIDFFENMEPFNPANAKPGQLLFDLGNVSILAKVFDDPQDKVPCVHITGTNGKGSVAAFLSSILTSAGYKTGTFSSPYLRERTEQIQINGTDISQDEFAEVAGDVIRVAKDLPEGNAPSEFEITAVTAFEYFSRKKCDIAVIEVGLGGEYDATNIISSPLLCLFTKIGKDHAQVLGDTVEDIARIKSGIIKDGTRVISSKNPEEVVKILFVKCNKMHAEFTIADSPEVVHTKADGSDFEYTFMGEKSDFHLATPGMFQTENAALAIKAAETLARKGYVISLDDVRAGLAKVKRQARFEILKDEPIFIADGSHNTEAVKALAKSLDDIFPDKRFIFIAGVLADKDYGDMLEPLVKVSRVFYCVTPDSPRALPSKKLADTLESKGAKAVVCGSVDDAVSQALSVAGDGDVIVAFGSFYYMGRLREILKKG